MKGYKAFNNDMTTNHGDNTVYEVGKTYTVEGEVKRYARTAIISARSALTSTIITASLVEFAK